MERKSSLNEINENNVYKVKDEVSENEQQINKNNQMQNGQNVLGQNMPMQNMQNVQNVQGQKSVQVNQQDISNKLLNAMSKHDLNMEKEQEKNEESIVNLRTGIKTIGELCQEYRSLKDFYQKGKFGDFGDALLNYNKQIINSVKKNKKTITALNEIVLLNKIIETATIYIEKHASDKQEAKPGRFTLVEDAFKMASISKLKLEAEKAAKDNGILAQYENKTKNKTVQDQAFVQVTIDQLKEDTKYMTSAQKKEIVTQATERLKSLQKSKSNLESIQKQNSLDYLNTEMAIKRKKRELLTGKIDHLADKQAKILFLEKKQTYLNGEINNPTKVRSIEEIEELEGFNEKLSLEIAEEKTMYKRMRKLKTRAFNLTAAYLLRVRTQSTQPTQEDLSNLSDTYLDEHMSGIFSNLKWIKSNNQEEQYKNYVDRVAEYANECGINLNCPQYNSEAIINTKTKQTEFDAVYEPAGNKEINIAEVRPAVTSEIKMAALENALNIKTNQGMEIKHKYDEPTVKKLNVKDWSKRGEIDKEKIYTLEESKEQVKLLKFEVPELECKKDQDNQTLRLKNVTAELLERIKNMKGISDDDKSELAILYENAFYVIPQEEILSGNGAKYIGKQERNFSTFLFKLDNVTSELSYSDRSLIKKYLAGISAFSRGNLQIEKGQEEIIKSDKAFGEVATDDIKKRYLRNKSKAALFEDAKKLPLFMHEPSVTDVKQGNVGDCVFLAAVQEVLAQNPGYITDMMKDNGSTVTVRFYSGNKPFYVTVDKTIPAINKEYGKSELYAVGTLWVKILEKAATIGLEKLNKDQIKKGTRSKYQEVGTGYNILHGVFEKDAFELLLGKDIEEIKTSGKFDNPYGLEKFLFNGGEGMTDESVINKLYPVENKDNPGVAEDQAERSMRVDYYKLFKQSVMEQLVKDKIPIDQADAYKIQIYISNAAKEIYDACKKYNATATINIDGWDIYDSSEEMTFKNVILSEKNRVAKEKNKSIEELTEDEILDKIDEDITSMKIDLVQQIAFNVGIEQHEQIVNDNGSRNGEQLSSYEYSENEQKMFNYMQTAFKDHKSIIYCVKGMDEKYTEGKKGTVGEHASRGLFLTHAYSVHGFGEAVVDGVKKNYVLVRNPHSHNGVAYEYTENKGLERKSDENKKFSDNHDGLFYMELREFLASADNVSIQK